MSYHQSPSNDNERIKFSKLLLAVAGALFGLVAKTVHASDEYYDLTLEDLMSIEVDTVSKKNQKVSDAPAMVYVITAKEIKERGYANLKDIFHDLPGMGVHENFFSEQGTLVAVRGIAGNNKIITLVDGIRVNPPGNEHQPIRSDISVRAAKQVEIIYGPGSTLYGNDAISMVVNIITQKPNEDWRLDAHVYGGAGNVSGDSGQHKEAYLSFGKRFGENQDDFSLSGFIQWQDAELDDYADTFPQWYSAYQDRDGGNTPKVSKGTYRDDKALNFMLRLEGKSGSFSLWHRDSQRNSGEGGFTPVLQMVPEAIWRDTTTVIDATHLFIPTEHLELESSVTASQYEINPDSRYIFNPSPGAPLFLQDWKYGEGKGINLEERLSWTPSNDLSVMGGLVFSYRNILPKATVNRSDEPGFNANQSGLDGNLDILGQGQNFTWYENNNGVADSVSVSNYTLFIYQTYAAYIESQWNASKKIRLVGGLRIDKDSRFNEKPVSPRLAIIYTPSDKLAIKALATKAFVNPAPYFNFAAFNGTNYIVPNPDLEPELAESIELNTTYTTNSFMAGLSFYFNKQDKILFHGDEGLDFQLLNDISGRVAPPVYQDALLTTPAGVAQSVNSGDGKSRGIDLYFKYNSSYGSFWASYSHIEYEVTINNQEFGLDALADQHFRIGATSRFFNDTLITTLSGSWRSSLERLDGNTAGLDSYIEDPSYVNAFISYQASKQLALTIKNK